MVDRVPFNEKWRPLADIGGHLKMMVRNANGVVDYAPLYVHSFDLLQPHKLVDAEKFNIIYSDIQEHMGEAF